MSRQKSIQYQYKVQGWYNICQSAGIGEFEISVISESKWWINPMGASGRGDALIDQTGIRVHWIEIISSA